MKLKIALVIFPLFAVVPLLQAQTVPAAVHELSVQELAPQDFVDVVTGEKGPAPGARIFKVDRNTQPAATTARPSVSLPAYGSTINAIPLAQPDVALASAAGLYFNMLNGSLQEFSPEDAARLEATRLSISIGSAAQLVAYSEALVLQYRKTFTGMMVKICQEYDTHVLSRGEENAISLFNESFKASEPFIPQFYLDAFVDLDRHLDAMVVTQVVARITAMASNRDTNPLFGEKEKNAAGSASWINGYCAARIRDQEKLASEN